jgi:TonB-linked SusC/RagA family outer membrane protein
MLLCGFSANAQMRVTGTVTGAEDGKPVAFASVIVKNTSTAVTTGEDGTYSITVPDGDAVLVFSFFGMQSREEAVGGRGIIDVMLESDAFALDESIVVAYGTATKGTFTGAASVVKQDAIKDVPELSFQNALNGKVPGLQVTTSSGMAGAAPDIRIRGTGSMNAGNNPLYVVDGVPVASGTTGQLSDAFAANMNNVMGTINPADIESITVLKDAAASALYGSRAANGVILIQTKKGRRGKAKVDFRASIALTPSFATDNWERASDEENVEMYYRMFWDRYVNAGESYASASSKAIAQLNNRFNKHGYAFSAPDDTVNSLTISDYDNSGRAGTYFDWEDALFRTAIYQTYEASVSGGSETTTYYTSIGYTQEDGRVKKNNYERITGRLNLTQKIGKYVEVGSNVNFAKTRNVGFNDSRNTSTNMFMQVRNLLWGMYWPTDYKTGEPWTERYGSYGQNHLYYNDEWSNSAKTLRISAIENVTVKILPELTARTTLSYDNINTRDYLYYSPFHFSGGSVRGLVTNYNTTTNKLVSSTVLDFNKAFDRHTVAALVGWEAEKNRTDYIRAEGQNLGNSDLPSVSTAGLTEGAGYWWGNNMLSFLSRVEYNYDNKYYVSGSYRRDGSSRLGPDTRWGNFWSVAGSWRISNEAFMEDISWLSNLRLRASYGVNGTLPSSNYAYMSLIGYTSKYMEEPGGLVTTKPDPNLKWENNYTANVALEFGLFKNRVTGTIEFFNRDSKNLLQNVPISMVTGVSPTLTNVGEINNKGLEIELWGNILSRGDFKWNMGITASLIKSEVTDLYGGQDIIFSSDVDAFARRIYRVGESPMSFYGLEWAGVESATGTQVWYLNNNETPDLMFNGKPATYDYTKASEIVIGKADPKIFGGINTDFSWKNLSLGLNFIYKIGGDVYDGVSRDVTDDGYYWERIRSKDQYENRWTESNKNAKYPQMLATDMEDVLQRSSRFIHDGSFIRLKNITLSYTLPKKIVEKVSMSNARVYFTGSNLLTWSSYGLYDPETPVNGVKTWAMPIGKTYTFGVEVSF